ncbi:MAG: hypothetical protein AAB038_00395 [Planctomycetota bacterium]
MPTRKIVSHAEFFIPLDLQEVPAHMSDEWANTQKNKIATTEYKRTKVIPNEAAYINKMAGPSSEAYAKFVSPTFRSRSGKNRDAIVAAQFQNVSKGYRKYRATLDHLCEIVDGEPAKRYKQRIDIKKHIYSRRMAQSVLPFTGEKTIGKSVCGIVPPWLAGDMKSSGLIRGADKLIGGGPVNVAKTGLETALKAALSSQLLKAGAIIVNSKFNPAVMKQENDAINAVLSGLQDTARYAPFETGGASRCDYFLDEKSLMFLDVQVTEIVI